MSGEQDKTRWSQIGGPTGDEYAARFAEQAAAGRDVHGEATYCSALLPPGSRVLDAGCGTGRVAARLDELGHRCVGVDLDESMLVVARRTAPQVPWHRADLSRVTEGDLDGAHDFDLVVMAGNVVPLLAEGTVGAAVRALSSLLAPRGLLVAGFGLDSAHLPPGCPVTPLEEYDAACTAAGLTLRDRHATWQADTFGREDGYAVSVHVVA